MYDVFSSKFAQDIVNARYAWTKEDGTKETWAEICHRVVSNVCHGLIPAEVQNRIYAMFLGREATPGGRYLANSGRKYHQISNCLGAETEIVTRRGLLPLGQLSGSLVSIRNKYGQWEDGEVRNFGRQQLFKVTLSNGTQVRATAGHRWFLSSGDETTTERLTTGAKLQLNTPAGVEADATGIRHGIIFGDGSLSRSRTYASLHLIGERKQELYKFFPNERVETCPGHFYQTVRDCKTGKVVSLQPKHWKGLPPLEVSPEYARGFIAGLIATDGSTKTTSVTISCEGITRAQHIAKLAVLGGCIVNKVSVISRVNPFNGSARELCTVAIKPISAPLIRHDQIADMHSKSSRLAKMWLVVESVLLDSVEDVFCVTNTASGSFTLWNGLSTGNCYLFRAEDSREGWGSLLDRVAVSLMTGGGIGVDYSDIRARGTPLVRGQGKASGPVSLAQAVNEVGRQVRDNNERRSAIYGSLHWRHPDIQEWMGIKNWKPELRALKEADPNFPMTMELTNISVNYDQDFFDQPEIPALFYQNVRQSMMNGEPGFSFNYKNPRETLRNAPVSASTMVLTADGYTAVRRIVGIPTLLWTGERWAMAVFKKTKENVPTVVVRMDNGRQIACDPEHEFKVEYQPSEGTGFVTPLICSVPAGDLKPGNLLVSKMPLDMVQSAGVVVVSVTSGQNEDVYCCDVGVPEHTFCAEGVIISNCCEVVSEDDSDKCNLGTLWMGRYQNLDEFADACELLTVFLLCGGIYTDNPTEKIAAIGKQNNRIGVGLGGLFEWLMLRGHDFEVVPDLHKWLSVYRDATTEAAHKWSKILNVNVPKGIRAIAPTGTIGIVAEQTTSAEPLFCAAYRRGYIKDGKHLYQYVVDETVKRLTSAGVPLERIERNDAYALGFEQRVAFQADCQDYVDMAISSTCNLPPWGSEGNNEDLVEKNAKILHSYSPRLRGFTMYPDGSRAGQPLIKVPVSEAQGKEGVVYLLEENRCSNGVCGI